MSQYKNFADTLVATAPSPATSGTSMVVSAGEGALMPDVPFPATVCPAGTLPTTANAEVVQVTARATDTLTITRAQEGSVARTIVVGDRVFASVTAGVLELKAPLASPIFTGPTSVDGGLHVGGGSDAGDNNLLVDGTASITGALSVSSNSVIAGTGAAANNLIIRTDSTNSPGVTFQNNGGVGLAVMAATNAKGFEWLVNDGSAYGIEISSTGRVAIRNGGLHVGGTSDAGNDNLLVDGTVNDMVLGYGGGAITTNTALGVSALDTNTTGGFNTAIGYNALTANLTGPSNVAVGYSALALNTDGTLNTAVGVQTLGLNVSGTLNTAVGYHALVAATVSRNTAVGAYAGNAITTGPDNTAVGHEALYTNISGQENTAIGRSALNVATGRANVALGYNAGGAITTGNYNVVIGGNDGTSVAALSNRVILADGQGNIRLTFDNTGVAAFAVGPTGPTAAVDTNTTQLATTAMVVAQAGASNPLMNGAVAVGTSLRYSRQDHVHASDTSLAPLASPTLTGVPAAPTAALGTSTTQIATTAFAMAAGGIVYVPTTGNTAVNVTSDATIVTRNVTGVVAGDQVIVEGWFTILNDSTATRVYVVTLDFDGLFDVELSTGACAFSSTLMHPFIVRAVCDVRSTSLAYAMMHLTGQLAAGIASGTDTNAAASHLTGMGWGTSASDATGTLTVALKVRSADATATQTLRLHQFSIQKVSPTP